MDIKREDITAEQFSLYLEVRDSGMTNMFDVKMVEQLSGLSRPLILAIMTHFTFLTQKYG